MPKLYCEDLAKESLMNTDFHRVLYTGDAVQLVVTCLLPNEEIGMETHPENEQFVRIESGEGRLIIGKDEFELADGMSAVIPMNTEHNIINTSPAEPLKLYTIYSPPHLTDGTVHATKVDHEAEKEEAKT